MPEKPNILIAVPAYGGSTKNETVYSLIALTFELLQRRIPFRPIIDEFGDVEKARNWLASYALSLKATFTHILFIDYDLIFTPGAIMKMINADRPVIAVNCPLRKGANKLEFSAQPHYDDGRLEADGTQRVKRIGTGLMLISVQALETLSRHNALRVEHSLTGDKPVYGFFDRSIRANGERLGEDYSFCERWTDLCGGEIYAVIDEEIGHIDKYIHRGRFSDYL